MSEKLQSMEKTLGFITEPRLRKFLQSAEVNIRYLFDEIEKLKAAEAVGWRTLTMLNGWTTLTGREKPEYFKDKDGWVHLKGTITGGTASSGTIITTLPKGYRPDKIWELPISSNPASARIDVQPDGNILIYNVASAQLGISGVFYASR